MSSSSTDPGDDPRFDGLLLNLAQSARGIEPMLDALFGFLRRKTDFYKGPQVSHLTEAQKEEMAFQSVKKAYDKHAELYKKELTAQRQKEEERKRKKEAAEALKKKKAAEKAKAEKAAQGGSDVLEIGADGGFDLEAASSSHPARAPPPTPPPSEVSDQALETNDNKKDDNKKDDEAAMDIDKKEDDEDDNGPPPIGNGGTVEGKYTWTQTLKEVNLVVPLPENTRGRDLLVDIRKTHLKIKLKKDDRVIVDDDLSKPIVIDETFWTVEDGNKLQITMQKISDMEWWSNVCQNDPKINIQKIVPENSNLSDLDGDTRQTVEKMMYDQRQKALNLPTSEEQRKNEMLEKFKAAHPEMDFSNCKYSF